MLASNFPALTRTQDYIPLKLGYVTVEAASHAWTPSQAVFLWLVVVVETGVTTDGISSSVSGRTS